MACRRQWRPKTNPQWRTMTNAQRRAWIGALSDAQLMTQASVRMKTTRQTIAEVLTSWCLNEFVSCERLWHLLTSLLLPLGDVLYPPIFHFFVEHDRLRAACALGLLDRTGRYAFAVECSTWEGLTPVGVLQSWFADGLIERI